MDSIRGQGGIQMLLTAEQEAQQIVSAARNEKMARLRQAKDEAESEVANYRAHLEAEYQKSISDSSGNSDSTVKRLEAETEQKIEDLKKRASEVSPKIVKMLVKITGKAEIRMLRITINKAEKINRQRILFEEHDDRLA